MTYDIESVTNWDALCRVSHGMMRDKGWWDDGSRPLHWLRLLIASEIAEAVECLRLLIASEIAEAVECLRDGKIETWYQESGKPEGFWVELADALIRLADAVGGGVIECGCVNYSESTSTKPLEFSLALDRFLFDLALDEYRDAVLLAFALAASHQHDLWATIREKLAYNATRPHKHGRKA
jgi:hypothetical protein